MTVSFQVVRSLHLVCVSIYIYIFPFVSICDFVSLITITRRWNQCQISYVSTPEPGSEPGSHARMTVPFTAFTNMSEYFATFESHAQCRFKFIKG